MALAIVKFYFLVLTLNRDQHVWASPINSCAPVSTTFSISAPRNDQSPALSPLTRSKSLDIVFDPSASLHDLPSATPLQAGNMFSVQALSKTVPPGTEGIYITTLDITGEATGQPFNTAVQSKTSGRLNPIVVTTLFFATTPGVPKGSTSPMPSPNVFTPVDAQGIPANIKTVAKHPVPKKGISAAATDAIDTSKFYANLFLGNQNQAVWTHPYSVGWAQGTGNARSWGISISHIEQSQLAFAPGSSPSRYYINPIGIQSIILSANELSSSSVLTTDTLRAFSVNCNLGPAGAAKPLITFPLLQGMGFVTGKYQQATPLVQSSVFFRSFSGPTLLGSTYKYTILLEDGHTWLVYLTPTGPYNAASFKLLNSTSVMGAPNFTGILQIAKNPNGSAGEAVYDRSAGVYPAALDISASVSGISGQYSFSWEKQGQMSKQLLMYALPHHASSFDSKTSAAKTSLQLRTTTKGMATAILADQWTMLESNLPTDMGFAPWTPIKRSINTVSATAKTAINNAAASELNQNFPSQTNLSSMYFSGKGLAKFAFILYATHDMAGNSGLATAGLNKLKTAFAVFVNNQQQYPLVFDEQWRGVVSKAGYTDSNADFGNTYYNDHHFHYGYFVYTAAVIAYLDPTWLAQGANKAWVQTLVKDYANPVRSSYAPFSRTFDWWHGHSWAKGLYESGDGKDEESTSEDAFSSFAIKMWGKVIGDANMEARGNLMLAIQARTLPAYFLLESTNTNQPAEFIGNKVTGILFENKVDHATYFGLNTEYIEGIHMLPLGPHSGYTRRANFVQEEWNTYFSNGRVDSVQGGWRGILYANYALINPSAAWAFFSQRSFDASWLDGGASLTWYLAWSAALGGI